MNTSASPSSWPDTTAAAPRLDPQNPWPGLAPYDEEAREYFQGRDEEAEHLTGLIQAYPVVSLYGKSGLGKSSLLQAGVFPRLRKLGFLPVYARVDFSSTTATPWDQLAQRLCEVADLATLERPPLRSGEGLWHYLHRKDFELWTDDNHLRTPVLVLDQFEEIFSRPGATPKNLEPIFDALGDMVENRIPSAIASDKEEGAALDLTHRRYRVVLSFREDFLADLRAWESRLPSMLRQSVRLLPMSRERAIEAVVRAGKAVLAPDTAGPIVDFIAGGQHGAQDTGPASVEPVMLSLCCTQLNRRRLAGKLIDVDLLRMAGPNIIEDFYAEAMRRMPDSVHQFIEDHLVQGDRTRGSYARDEAFAQGYINAAQLHELTSVHRLLRVDPQGNVPRIELIHDRLVEVVRRARDARRGRLEADRAREKVKRKFLHAMLGLTGLGLLIVIVLGVKLQHSIDLASLAAKLMAQKQNDLTAKIVELDTARDVVQSTTLRLDRQEEKAAPKATAISAVAVRKLVYIQYGDESQKPRALALQHQLDNAGWSAPGVERVASVPTADELRYFRGEDANAAAELVTFLDGKAGLANLKLKRIDGLAYSTQQSQFELWLARTDSGNLTQLADNLNATSKDQRLAAGQILQSRYTNSQDAVAAVLALLEPNRLDTLSVEGRLNALYYLSRTSSAAWTTELERKGRAAVELINQRGREGVAIGSQTRAELQRFLLVLDAFRAGLGIAK
jgi:hypothetical protein